jgi:hypothetical protein
MSSYIKKIEELKVKLFRLHFLLTEEQTEQFIRDAIEQFKICYEGAMECLEIFIQNEYNQKSKSFKHTLELALEHRLFNQGMIESMQQMLDDYNAMQKRKKAETIYPLLQEKYARFLQMIYDMLMHMGEEAEEE